MNVIEQLQGMQEQSAAAIVSTRERLATFEAANKQVDDVLIFLRTVQEDLDRIGLAADVIVGPDARVSINFDLTSVQCSVPALIEPAETGAAAPSMASGSEPDPIEKTPDASANAQTTALAPVKKARGGQLAMAKGPRNHKVGPYTEVELDFIKTAIDDGKDRDQIAKELNRSAISVGMKISRFKTTAAKKARLEARLGSKNNSMAKGVPETGGDFKPPYSGSVPAAKPVVSDAITAPADREVIAHLNALGYAGDWTAAKDFDVLSGLASGKAAALVADDLGLEVGDVVTRFKALNTKIGDIGHQSRLVRILRQRAGA